MLEWTLQHGDIEAKIREDAAKSNMPLPDFILNKPTLDPGLELFWFAFNELNTCRNYGMSQGPIPWTAIRQFAEAYGWTEPGFFTRFLMYIRAMDNAMAKFYDEKRKVEAAKSKSGGKGTRTRKR